MSENDAHWNAKFLNSTVPGNNNIASLVNDLNAELETLESNNGDELVGEGEALLEVVHNSNEDTNGETDGNANIQDDRNATHIVDDSADGNEPVEVMVGGRRIKNVRQASINAKATINTFATGFEQLRNENLVCIRFQHHQPLERSQ